MKKIKLIPALITLLAGARTSVSLYLLGYDYITMLLILLAVIIIFYVIGVMIMRYFRGIYLKRKEIEDAKKKYVDKFSLSEIFAPLMRPPFGFFPFI